MEWGRVLHWAFAERIVSLPHKGEMAPLPDAPTQWQVLNTDNRTQFSKQP